MPEAADGFVEHYGDLAVARAEYNLNVQPDKCASRSSASAMPRTGLITPLRDLMAWSISRTDFVVALKVGDRGRPCSA